MRSFDPPQRRPQIRTPIKFTWFRCDCALPRHPKWRLVSEMTGFPVGNVVAVVIDLIVTGSNAEPRGFVGDFRPYECAATYGYAPEDVQVIYDALCSAKVGFIHDDHIVDWETRNPRSPDATNADRQRRYRERQKEREALRNAARVTDEVVHKHEQKPLRNGTSVHVDERNGVTIDSKINGLERNGVTPLRNVMRNTQYKTYIKSSSESVSRVSVDKSEFSTDPHVDDERGMNGRSRAGSLATARDGRALARRNGQEDGITDEPAFERHGIIPTIPNPLRTVAERQADDAKWTARLNRLLGGPTGKYDGEGGDE